MGNFSNLPSEMMLDIFTRLPTESVLESKLVSKTWRNVIRNKSFAQMHSNILLSHSPSAAVSGKLSFILKMDDLPEQFPKRFYYLEYDDEASSHRIKKMNFNPPFERYILVGSCNGLICLIGLPSSPNDYDFTIDEYTSASYVAYICNPISREAVTLPELDRKTYHLVDQMVFGFGYVASANEYKVVRLYTFKRDPKVAHIDVYTLGNGKGWRNAGTMRNSVGFSETQDGLFANGYVYWDFGNGRTVVYDLADEIFVGDSDFPNEHIWHGVMGGHLYGIDCSEDTKSSDIWLLKKNEDKSFGWCKEFSLISEDSYNTPFAFTSNGTVLGYSYTKLYLYDLKSTSSKVLQDLRSRIFYARRHVNTLVSLKAFGEENTTTLE